MSDILFHQLDISDKEKIKKIEEIIGINIVFHKNDDMNQLDKYIYTEKGKQIKDVFLIQCLKDIKNCNVIWINMESTGKNILNYAVDYALETMGMEEAFIRVDINNKSMIKFLENNGFESLGEEQGSIVFLKEKEEQVKNRII